MTILYIQDSQKKILKRVREGRLDPEPIRLNGDGLLRTQVRDSRRAGRRGRIGGREFQCRRLCEGQDTWLRTTKGECFRLFNSQIDPPIQNGFRRRWMGNRTHRLSKKTSAVI